MGKEPPGKKEGCDCKRFLKNNWLLLSTILAVVLGESQGRPFGREGRAAEALVSSCPLPAFVGEDNVMWFNVQIAQKLERFLEMRACRFPLALLPKKGYALGSRGRYVSRLGGGLDRLRNKVPG